MRNISSHQCNGDWRHSHSHEHRAAKQICGLYIQDTGPPARVCLPADGQALCRHLLTSERLRRYIWVYTYVIHPMFKFFLPCVWAEDYSNSLTILKVNELIKNTKFWLSTKNQSKSMRRLSEMSISENGPLLHQADPISKRAMNNYWKGGPWHFIWRYGIYLFFYTPYLRNSLSCPVPQLQKMSGKWTRFFLW